MISPDFLEQKQHRIEIEINRKRTANSTQKILDVNRAGLKNLCDIDYKK